jgi:hypothetical protein
VVAGVAAASAAAGIAIGAAAAMGAGPWSAPPPSGGTPTVMQTPSATAVDRLPAKPPTRDGVPLPRTVDMRPSGVKGIAARPLPRAVALYQQEPAQTEKLPLILALGTGNQRRWLDGAVTLHFTRDAAGKLVTPLLPTSLSPDGRRAAFGQHDTAVVVDLTTGQADSIKLPGWNWYVLWIGNTKVLVGQAGATYVVDLAHGTTKPLTARLPLWDVAADRTGPDQVVEMPANAGQLTLREWTVAGTSPPTEVQIDQSRLGGYRITSWQGPAWRSGDLIVRAGAGTGPDSRATDLVGVVNIRTGVVVRLLDAAATPLGWLDGHTVLLQTTRQGIVAWDIHSGQIMSVSAPFDGTVAISPQ